MKKIQAFIMRVFNRSRVFNIAQTNDFENESLAGVHKMTTLFLCDRCKNYSTSRNDVRMLDGLKRYDVCDFCFKNFSKYLESKK